MSSFDKVREIIASTLGVDKCLITQTLAMEDIDQWDSVGNIAIITALEENLGIEIPMEDLFELNSISAIVEEIDKLLNN